MNSWENGLFTRGQKWIQSPTFLKRATKIMSKYGQTPTIPEMVPVYFNRRMSGTLGRFYGDKIEMSYHHYRENRRGAEDTLRHEIVHLFIHVNYPKLVTNQVKVNYAEFEKICFVVMVGGAWCHNAWTFKYTCVCGHWVKNNEDKSEYWCTKCGRKYVSKIEYNKLVRISKINSKIIPVNINKYGIISDVKEKLVEV